MLKEEDKEYAEWKNNFQSNYEDVLYKDKSLLSYIQCAGHKLCERPFTKSAHFDNVLEVGCGSGVHKDFVQHGYSEYHFLDTHAGVLDSARNKYSDGGKRHFFHVHDSRSLDFPDNHFDRIISTYMLEHITEPHIALQEWARVLKPGGVLSIVVPTEGGLAWNLGRYLTTRRIYKSKGIDYDYIVSREHVNACYRIIAFVRHYFPSRQENWFPLPIPSPHVNLFYAVHAYIQK